MFYKGSAVIGIAVASPRPVFLHLFILCPFLALCNMFLAEDKLKKKKKSLGKMTMLSQLIARIKMVMDFWIQMKMLEVMM